MKIGELLDGIRKQDLVLPEFQREYVWTLDCIAPGSLDTSLSHAAGLSDIAVCHA